RRAAREDRGRVHHRAQGLRGRDQRDPEDPRGQPAPALPERRVPMTWADVLAVANLVLGIGGFSWLLLRTSRRWGEYPEEVRKLLMLEATLFFVLLITTLEIYLKQASRQLVLGVLLISVVKLNALYVLWATQDTK